MRALVYEGPRLMHIRDVPAPVPERDEVVIRVELAGICGSELSGYLGQNSLRKPPLVMGHEFSGVIEQTGADAGRFRPGERVTANPLVTCGRCRACTSGAAQLCAERKLIGAHRPGAFAGYVAVPENNVYALPDNITFADGALTEPFACAVHICNLLRLHPADSLLILGAGPIGLLTLQAAALFGVREIAIADLSEERLSIARILGGVAVTALHPRSLEGQSGRFDAAVDAVGAEATRRACLDAVRPGGRVVFSGLHEDMSRFPVNALIRNEICVLGAFAYSVADFETALRWISLRKANLRPWTRIAPLAEGGDCFETLLRVPGNTAKIMLAVNA